MKRILLCALCVLCGQIATFADDPGSGTAGVSPAQTEDNPTTLQLDSPTPTPTPLVTTLLSDGSTNTWTQADLVAALQLMNRKYHRDVETPNGRTAWHGKLVMQTIDTNRLVKIERYADGTEFEFPFTPPASKSPTPTKFSNSNIPAPLAAARARRAAERSTTNTVTVVVTPDTDRQLGRAGVSPAQTEDAPTASGSASAASAAEPTEE